MPVETFGSGGEGPEVPTDLITVDEVRAFLQKPEGDTAQDTIIQSLIAAAGLAIGNFCEREFLMPPEDASLARNFEYRGGGFLSVAPFDLRELESIRIDVDEEDPTELTPDEYRLPAPNREGTTTYLRLAPYLVHSRSRWQQRVVEVTGKWGFESVPVDVKQAAIVTVAIWLRRDVSAFSTVFNLDEAHVERPEVLPAAAARMLFPYKRQAYA
jgi:hypothetical protein